MIKQLMPANLKRVVVYLQPISMRWGTTKLRALCEEELGIEPDSTTAFLFVNKSHDSLLLYSMDPDGDRTLMKKIEKGAFMMPAPGPDGASFIIMRPAILSRMFRS
jgi:IS66 Orf2 like protein